MISLKYRKKRERKKKKKKKVKTIRCSSSLFLTTSHPGPSTALLLRRLCGTDIVNTQQETRTLDGGLDALHLDGLRFPDAELFHVDDGAGVAVYAP